MTPRELEATLVKLIVVIVAIVAVAAFIVWDVRHTRHEQFKIDCLSGAVACTNQQFEEAAR
jgi:hypothetical protein